MRIVWAASYGGRHRGSFVPAVESVARRVLARGDFFALVVPDVGDAAWHDEIRALGVDLHVVPDRPVVAARRVAALRADLVHAHFLDWLAAVTVATWPSRARLLWHLHSTFEKTGRPARRSSWRSVKYGGLTSRAETVVCVSAAIAADARTLGVAARKLAVVPNAVDTSRFRPPDPGERAAARARLGLGEAAAIAFFGRDPHIKGADLLAAALARMDAPTVVAVATPDGTVADLARHARVVSVPFTDDVREVLWAVDAIALPSRGEGMPFVALEALACGVPVVASELPWAAELAARNRGVRLARADDPAAFATALQSAIDGPRAEPPAGGNVDAWAERILELYAAAPGTAHESVTDAVQPGTR